MVNQAVLSPAGLKQQEGSKTQGSGATRVAKTELSTIQGQGSPWPTSTWGGLLLVYLGLQQLLVLVLEKPSNTPSLLNVGFWNFREKTSSFYQLLRNFLSVSFPSLEKSLVNLQAYSGSQVFQRKKATYTVQQIKTAKIANKNNSVLEMLYRESKASWSWALRPHHRNWEQNVPTDPHPKVNSDILQNKKQSQHYVPSHYCQPMPEPPTM